MTWLTNPYRFGAGGPAPMPAATHWQLVFHGCNQGVADWSRPSMAAIEMAGSVGGANLCSSGTSSGTTPASGSIANLFDTDAATYAKWSAPGEYPYVRYIFPVAVSINAMRIQADTAGFHDYMMRGYTPQYSLDSGATWISCEPVGPYGAFTAGQWQEGDVVPLIGSTRADARFWGLRNITGPGETAPSGDALSAVKWRLTSGGTNLATGGLGWGSGETFQGPFWEAYTTSSDASVGTSYARYFFPTAPNPQFLSISAVTGSFFADRGPTNFTPAWSLDGINWTSLTRVTNEATWVSGDVREYAL